MSIIGDLLDDFEIANTELQEKSVKMQKFIVAAQEAVEERRGDDRDEAIEIIKEVWMEMNQLNIQLEKLVEKLP